MLLLLLVLISKKIEKMVITILLLFLILLCYVYLLIYPNSLYHDCFINNNNNPIDRLKRFNEKEGSSFYSMSVFTDNNNNNDFMIILYPQRYHFFVENNGNEIFYHPLYDNDGILKQYYCQDQSLDLVYNITRNPPVVTCHKNLKYLKKYVYKQQQQQPPIYTENFDEFKQPLECLFKFLKYIKNSHYSRR